MNLYYRFANIRILRWLSLKFVNSNLFLKSYKTNILCIRIFFYFFYVAAILVFGYFGHEPFESSQYLHPLLPCLVSLEILKKVPDIFISSVLIVGPPSFLYPHFFNLESAWKRQFWSFRGISYGISRVIYYLSLSLGA